MANPDQPHGFRPLILRNPSASWYETFVKLVGVGTAIFPQDVVHNVGGTSLSEGRGAIEPASTGTPGTTRWQGVAMTFGKASTKTRHSVIVDETCLFEAQDDDSTDGITAANANKNANLIAGAGSTFGGGLSGHEIAEASVDVSASRDFQLLGLLDDGINVFGAHAKVIVKFNLHRELGSGVGV